MHADHPSLDWPETGWWRFEKRAPHNGLLVVFSALNIPRDTFSWSAQLARFSADLLFVNCPNNSAYIGGIPGLGNDTQAAGQAIGELSRRYQAQGKRVVFFGESMGAPAAITYAGVARPDAVVSLAPVTVAQMPGGLPTRLLGAHQDWLARQDLIDQLLSAYRGDARVIAGADSLPDVRSARHYGHLNPAARIDFLVNVNHSVGSALSASQRLMPLLRDAMAGNDHPLPASAIDPHVPALEQVAFLQQGLHDSKRPSPEQLQALLRGLLDWPMPERAWGFRHLLTRAMDVGQWRWVERMIQRPVAGRCHGIAWDGLQARLAARRQDMESARRFLLAATQYPEAVYAEPHNKLWRYTLELMNGHVLADLAAQPQWFRDRLAIYCRDLALPQHSSPGADDTPAHIAAETDSATARDEQHSRYEELLEKPGGQLATLVSGEGGSELK